MGAQNITITTKAAVDDTVLVLNYKLRPARWEPATVKGVNCWINKEGGYKISYDVLLERRTTGRSRMFPDGGAPMYLRLGDDSIELIEGLTDQGE